MNDQINEENMSAGLRPFYITVEKTYRAPKTQNQTQHQPKIGQNCGL